MVRLATLSTLLVVPLIAFPVAAKVLAEHPPWSLSRVPDEKYGAGFGCSLTLSAQTARMTLTAYFLGADVEIFGETLKLDQHRGSLNLYVPALDSHMSISPADFDGQTVRARAGEQVLMQMLEAVSEAEASEIIVFDDETAIGGFKSGGLSSIMPAMRECFAGL